MKSTLSEFSETNIKISGCVIIKWYRMHSDTNNLWDFIIYVKRLIFPIEWIIFWRTVSNLQLFLCEKIALFLIFVDK